MAVFVYVVLDGFDLGIGILFPSFSVGPESDTAMNSIAPVWDGNQIWLVLGGGGLLAAFPLAYGLILSALYAPIIGLSVVVAYALLGATWLIFKTEGPLQRQGVRLAGWLGGATLLAVVTVSLATPFLEAPISSAGSVTRMSCGWHPCPS